MSELNYIPSWLDSAMTLLEKLNKCIEKIETIVNNVITVTKTANDALSLANTNESNITTLQGDITTIQGDITRLDNNISSTRELTDQALSTANRAETKADEATSKANANATNITALQNEKSGKLYLHQIYFSLNDFNVECKIINSESEPISNYEGTPKDMVINGFDFVGSGTVSTDKICTHAIGNPHYNILYGKQNGTVFSELMYHNFAFIDPDGTIFHSQELYQNGTPSRFIDTVTEL